MRNVLISLLLLIFLVGCQTAPEITVKEELKEEGKMKNQKENQVTVQEYLRIRLCEKESIQKLTDTNKQLVKTYLNYIKPKQGLFTESCEFRFLLIKQSLFPIYTFFNAWGSIADGHFFFQERIILRYQDKFLFVQYLTENSDGRIKLEAIEGCDAGIEAISKSQTKQGECIPLTDHFLNSLNSAWKSGHLNQVYIKDFLSFLSILKNNASQVTFVESTEDIPSPDLANLVRTNENSVNAKWIDDKPQPLQKLLINISSNHVSATGSLVTKQGSLFWLKNFKFFSDFKQIIFLETDLARTVVYIE